MTWTYWKKLGLTPERVRSVHRINDDPPTTQTWVNGEWSTVPGTSLANRDQDHLIEPITEAQAKHLTAGDSPRFEPAGDFSSVSRMLAALGVADAPLDEQRAAVRRVAVLDSVRPILEPLVPELRRRGLI